MRGQLKALLQGFIVHYDEPVGPVRRGLSIFLCHHSPPVPGRITELTKRGKLIHRSAYLSNATTCSVQGKAIGPARSVNCLLGMMLLFTILHTNFGEFLTF